jgi:hypothetical protein
VPQPAEWGATDGGPGFREVSGPDGVRNPELVAYWWRRNLWANIGFATGDGVAVLDVDSYKGAELDGEWPETLTARTANGGEYRYYVVDGPVPSGRPRWVRVST